MRTMPKTTVLLILSTSGLVQLVPALLEPVALTFEDGAFQGGPWLSLDSPSLVPSNC